MKLFDDYCCRQADQKIIFYCTAVVILSVHISVGCCYLECTYFRGEDRRSPHNSGCLEGSKANQYRHVPGSMGDYVPRSKFRLNTQRQSPLSTTVQNVSSNLSQPPTGLPLKTMEEPSYCPIQFLLVLPMFRSKPAGGRI